MVNLICIFIICILRDFFPFFVDGEGAREGLNL